MRSLQPSSGPHVTSGRTRLARPATEASLADPAAADGVRSGRLTSALYYAGLGSVDLSDAVAVPAARPERSRQPSRGAQKTKAGRGQTTRAAETQDAAEPGDAAESAA